MRGHRFTSMVSGIGAAQVSRAEPDNFGRLSAAALRARAAQKSRYLWSEASSRRGVHDPRSTCRWAVHPRRWRAGRDKTVWPPRPPADSHRSKGESRGEGHGAVHFAQAPGVSQTGQDIGPLKPRMAGQNVFHTVARAQIREHRLHGNPRVANYRLPVADSGNDFDAVHSGGVVSFPRAASRFPRLGPGDAYRPRIDTERRGFGEDRDESRTILSTEPSNLNFRSPLFQPATLNFRFSASPCVMPSTAAMRNQKKNWLLA